MRTGAIHPRILKRLEDTLRNKKDLLTDHQVEAIRVVERAIRELSLLADLPGLGFLNVLSPKYEIALAELTKIDPDRPLDRRRLLAMAEELRELDQFLATLSKNFRGAVNASPKAQGDAPSGR